jgi:hypothetical protein
VTAPDGDAIVVDDALTRELRAGPGLLYRHERNRSMRPSTTMPKAITPHRCRHISRDHLLRS